MSQDVLLLVGAALSGGLLTKGFEFLYALVFGRRKAKLDEADIMSRISTQLREELLQEKQIQDETIKALRKVIINLTELLDGMLPRIAGITEEEKLKLKAAYLEARLTGLAA